MEPILNVVLPVFGIIATGYGCGRCGLLGDDSTEALNRFVYWVALPVLLFRSMAMADLAELYNGAFLAAYIGGVLGAWVLAMAFARMVYGLRLAENALYGLNCVFANTGYMGIPLAITAFGQAAALPAIVATVIHAAILVTIATALIEFGQARGGGGSVGRMLIDVAGAIAKSPLIVAPVLGVLWALTGLALPGPVDGFTRILGAAAGPCALFAIGLFLVGRPISEGIGEVGTMTAFKLLLQPAIMAALVFWVFPMDPLWATVAVLMATLPTGASSFVLAQAYGTYVQRTSTVILITTVLSVITISVFFLVFPPTP